MKLAIADKPTEGGHTRGPKPARHGLRGTAQMMADRVTEQVEALPRETQTALLLIAAEPSGDPAIIGMAANALGISLTSLQQAVAEQLVRTHPRFEFRRAIVRSAVYSRAPLARRKEVHHALASAIDQVELLAIREQSKRQSAQRI